MSIEHSKCHSFLSWYIYLVLGHTYSRSQQMWIYFTEASRRSLYHPSLKSCLAPYSLLPDFLVTWSSLLVYYIYIYIGPSLSPASDFRGFSSSQESTRKSSLPILPYQRRLYGLIRPQIQTPCTLHTPYPAVSGESHNIEQVIDVLSCHSLSLPDPAMSLALKSCFDHFLAEQPLVRPLQWRQHSLSHPIKKILPGLPTTSVLMYTQGDIQHFPCSHCWDRFSLFRFCVVAKDDIYKDIYKGKKSRLLSDGWGNAYITFFLFFFFLFFLFLFLFFLPGFLKILSMLLVSPVLHLYPWI